MSIEEFCKFVLAEDVGRGDLYERIANKKEYRAVIKSNSEGVLAGVAYAHEMCAQNNIEISSLKGDGDDILVGELLLTLNGFDVDILRCERSILNTLQHASGIATNVRKYTTITQKYATRLLDTRKTRPLLRDFEKYATKIGGAVNHRFGLDDSLMIKDTHRKSITDLPLFLKEARKSIPFTAKIELECESYDDAVASLCLDIDIVMCDNMSATDVANVVKKRDEVNPKIVIEASGGINLDNIEEYCKCGVDAISVGSLIHQAVWLDFSMKGAS